ncbi:MAG: DUF5011 domain-containing protein [Bacteroidota bacterium]|nr:DUF5011 domain-containing protein [Bacteroidota bacterium]MDP4215125.1 DUF5011 domain-containing protein [Bacteroidota bacterium]MDP4247471.1 DUF5011 domain-containing protein [Bacteroidota bacterium]MDP4254319.1 DUF5011 domain-containing protein [Bacteroidota bacterium]MDP4258803.1 DUF5011 domain-containing protein [Bacteroidota bacterium]
MKAKQHIVLFLMLATMASVSCNKQTVVDNATNVGISKIVYFPSVTIKGDRVLSFTAGSTFTDPGVTATLNGKPTTVVTSPTISSSTAAGVYTVTYTATNPEGYTASDWRFVVVVPTSAVNDPVVAANDFSGTYLRAATGVTSTWTKIGIGVYQVENPGGASVGAGKIAVVTNFSGMNISMPPQNDPDYGGQVSTSGAVYSAGPPATYHWVFNAGGYGTGVRTFVKQ